MPLKSPLDHKEKGTFAYAKVLVLKVKRIIALLICVASVLTLIGCTDGTTSKTDDSKDSANEAISNESDSDSEKESETEMKEKIVVACVGDSITFGTNSTNPDVNSYPANLQKLLGPGYEVHNYGIPGAILSDNADCSYMSSQNYEDSLALNPDIIIIMLGTNDSVYITNVGYKPAFFKRCGKRMLEAYKALSSNPKIYMACPPHAYKGRTDVETSVEENIIPNILELTAEYDVTYIDMWKATENMDEYFPDGIHPSDEGYEIIAQIMYDAMNK